MDCGDTPLEYSQYQPIPQDESYVQDDETGCCKRHGEAEQRRGVPSNRRGIAWCEFDSSTVAIEELLREIPKVREG